MSHIEIYDRAMCCSTGVCGPQVDPVLPRFAGDLEWLKANGHLVERFNLAQEPMRFAQNAEVQRELAEGGIDCLPLIFIDGKLICRSDYPDRDSFLKWVATEAQSADIGAADMGAADIGAADMGEATCNEKRQSALNKKILPMADGGCCGGSGCC